jgi:hypothetical protein
LAGQSFIGIFVDDMRHGPGQHIFPWGATLTCTFVNDKKQGMTIYEHADGTKETRNFGKISEDVLTRTNSAVAKTKL